MATRYKQKKVKRMVNIDEDLDAFAKSQKSGLCSRILNRYLRKLKRIVDGDIEIDLNKIIGED